MPRFFKDMPKPEKGIYEAMAIRTTCFGSARIIWNVKINGRRRAYIVSRLMALWLDIITPFYDGEVGIMYAIREKR